MMNRENFYGLLESHDWDFIYSEDHDVFICGQESLRYMIRLATKDEALMSLYHEYREYISGDADKPLLKE